MAQSQNKKTLALVVALILSACAGSQDAVTNGPVPDPTKPVIGDPNAKGTIGIRNHNELRGALYAMMGFSASVTAVDTFLTTNRQTFSGAGFVSGVTPEEIQKRVEANFTACTAGVANPGQATVLGPLLAGWNLNVGPGGVSNALITSYSSGLWQVATGEKVIPSDVLNSIIQFVPSFTTGAANTAATTKSLAASICAAILSSPKALAVM